MVSFGQPIKICHSQAAGANRAAAAIGPHQMRPSPATSLESWRALCARQSICRHCAHTGLFRLRWLSR